LARIAGFYGLLMHKIHFNNHIGTKDMNLQDAFQTEIQFWDDMLTSQAEKASPEILERMKMAKSLAEQKLSLYSAECYERVN